MLSPAQLRRTSNSCDISFSDETTSYTASACYTFERTWMITVTDNNGNATTMTSMQTIQVADTTAPDIRGCFGRNGGMRLLRI